MPTESVQALNLLLVENFSEHQTLREIRRNSIMDTVNGSVGSGQFMDSSPIPSCITSTTGIVGNLLAIFVLCRSSGVHKWKTFYRLVFALAVTDFFGIITTTPVVLLVYANKVRFIGGQPVCDYLSFMMVFAGIATVFIVTTMAFDRFLAVWFPYTYSSTFTHRRITVTLICIWMLAVVLGCLPIFGFGRNTLQYPGTWCFFDLYAKATSDSLFAIFYAAIGLCVIAVSCLLNVLVIYKLKNSRRRYSICRKLSEHNAWKIALANRNNISQVVFLVAITVVFTACWAPLMVRIIINQIHETNKGGSVDLLAVRLASINQILNPWIYILLRREIFQSLCTIRRRCRGEVRNQVKDVDLTEVAERSRMIDNTVTLPPVTLSNRSPE